ncbi:hypothetical protein PBI_SCHIEBEL_37 [Mycobacterium phage Schiebel]|uniref:Uncharacterized protein n=1 Tax=Mycobacterium phage Angel TaxID=649688 RepID=C5IYB7_9CAUD|nr:hypothetical protein ANGEL_37 [Mycobacterium phage Angel]ACR77569.1 hypothetical protein ANGEL_37 [Mycobacterium phage Angel]AVR56851.1 hypothetical protein PBI_SCHIEBEL_37 [Mycobacterium phage Schiebel]AXH44753.1 hypothetical protein SEA_PLAGUEIS_37 [Mycobacterium phage Plagueis]UVT31411.1 hypothetical protein SEA_GOLDENASH_37 [Mycobacterium phage GoldenAsh]
MRAYFRRGRHRANKFSHTVSDVERCLDAEAVELDRRRATALVLDGRWAEVWGTNR